MTVPNMKDFLVNGAFLQTGTDVFTLLIGPFEAVSSEKLSEIAHERYLITTDFWAFLGDPENIALNSVYKSQSAHSLSRVEFISLIEDLAGEAPNIDWEAPHDHEFERQFQWSFEQFRSNKLEKTVPVTLQKGLTETGPAARAYMIRQLLQQNSYGWSYGYFKNDRAMLGHTPEILVQWNLATELLQTVALAGTVPRGEGAHEEIVLDSKIRREHEIVIEDIESKLQGLHLQKEKTHVLELKHLLHIKTDFHGRVHDLKAVLKSAQTLHPTAAMGVFPSSREALRQMAELPLQNERGLFASPFGLMTRDDVLIVVAIRNVILDKNEISLFSGCGVTVDSLLESELNELESKRNSVKKLLGITHDKR